MIQPDYQKSVEFLKWFHPGRRWVLTSIHPEKQSPPTCTATFDEAREAECLEWLQAQGLSRNIYFSVAEVSKDMTKKAERTDIANVWWFHVDIDPRAGEDVVAEQQRILGLLSKPHGKLPPPNVITFSGGGYQGFWQLDKPIPIDGKLAEAEDIKLYNLQIEVVLGADNCHNIDRIMRLPGTINRPDKKKLAKGRVEALAQIIMFSEKSFSVSDFSKSLPPKVAQKSADPQAPKIAAPSNVKRITSLDQLPVGVSNRLKAIIAQGHDPMEPQKYPSRSEWLFCVVCGLIRAGLTHDEVYAIITDPLWGISSSVIEKGNKAERYALRQIERAAQEANDPILTQMNERFCVIESLNGKCRVIEEQYDDAMKRKKIVRQTFEDFQNRYMNTLIPAGNNDKGEPTTKPLGFYWLVNANRRQYQRMVFCPGRDVSDAYNMWRGFGCEMRPGDCSLFLDHIRNVICSGNEEHYNYLIGWMANAVQHPDQPGHSAIVLKGDQGTGKSLMVKTFGSLFGRHFMQVTDPKHLVGSFNAHLRDCVVLFGDEAFFAGDKKHESILKMLITEELLTIEAKGIDAEQSGNYVHLLMASNDHWVVPAGVGDRRFFVLDVSRAHKEDNVYFGAIMDQIRDGGREAFLHFLMHYDLTKFDVRKIPKTEELQKQKMFSLPAEEMWWKEKLAEGRLLSEHGDWYESVAFGDLYFDYLTHCKTTSSSFRRATRSGLKMVLKKYMPHQELVEFHASGNMEVTDNAGNKRMAEKPLMLKFPPLSECRASFGEHFGGKLKWGGNDIGDQIDLYKDFR